MQEILKLGEYVVEGFMPGVKAVEKERETNNSRKYKGLPLKRKHHKKDPRNQIRKSLQTMNRILKEVE